jgi:uncharacterized alpha/beta hydrolase family protein
MKKNITIIIIIIIVIIIIIIIKNCQRLSVSRNQIRSLDYWEKPKSHM